MSLLKLSKVQKTYRTGNVVTRALRGVNLEIGKGEFTAVVGPSGSGKTTLMNIIGALDRADEGQVLLDGLDLSACSRNELSDVRLRQIGFVFQAYNLIPVLTALENVEYVMLLQGRPEKERTDRALAALDALGIMELADKRPNEMSGGQQQRVAVARAIVSEPKIVLADEPTANLDSQTSGRLMDLMRRLNDEKGITFVFSTHDPLVVERARRVLTIRDGKIIDEERAEGDSNSPSSSVRDNGGQVHAEGGKTDA